MPRSDVRTALFAEFTAGTVDHGVACPINAVGSLIILRVIAAGLLGHHLSRGGAPYAIGRSPILTATAFIENRLAMFLFRLIVALVNHGRSS